MRLFPYVLIRISGGPFEKLETLNLQESTKIIHDIFRYRKMLQEMKQKICDKLFHAIPLIKDNKIQNLLLNFKRDIFNERNSVEGKLEIIFPHVSKDVSDELCKYLEIKKNIQCLLDKGTIVFSKEIVKARENLCCLAKEGTLQKGLILSSQSLLKRLPDYLKKDNRELKKGDFKTEISLIKYISRIYAKTSPFSTFTNMAIAKILVNPRNQISEDNVCSFLYMNKAKKPEAISHIRLNNFLYAYLKGLITKNRRVYHYLLLRPNPTIKKHKDYYVFLTNSNNVEAFQRIPNHPIIGIILQITSSKNEGFIYKKLIQTIIDDGCIDASADDIEAYINRLIEYGFLEFNIGVSGIDPDWDIKLREKLKPLSENLSYIKELCKTLKKIREIAVEYGKSGLETRSRILMEAYSQFKAICMKLHEAAGLPEKERKSPEEQKKDLEKIKEKRKLKPQLLKNEQNQEKASHKEEIFRHHTVTYFHFKPEQMFYEDTSINLPLEMDEKYLTEYVSHMHNLLQTINIGEARLDERDRMKFYFLQKYGPDVSVDLLTFYEDYYREFKKPSAELRRIRKEEEKKIKLEKNNENKYKKDASKNAKSSTESDPELNTIPAIKERREKIDSWLNRFVSRLKQEIAENDEEIKLMFKQIMNSDAPRLNKAEENDKGCSWGALIQLISDSKKEKRQIVYVSNNNFAGFGKMMSRFLHIFDEKVTQDIQKWNQSLSQDDLLVEDCDASYFNANIHPPLMPFEIWMPNGHNSLPTEKQIPVTELKIELNKKEKQLQITHKSTKKRTYIFDCGFQGYKGRSQLFLLLEKFTLAKNIHYFPLLNIINTIQTDAIEEKRKIWIRPRIVYEKKVILQRKAWFIPKEVLPFKQSNESDWDYFSRINIWRMEQKIPDEIFIFVIGHHKTTDDIKPDAQKKIGRDDYKPQYISFKNPFLIKLFEKLIKKVPDTLKIEEMLPNSDQLLEIGKNRYVTEFLVQWYNLSPDRKT